MIIHLLIPISYHNHYQATYKTFRGDWHPQAPLVAFQACRRRFVLVFERKCSKTNNTVLLSICQYVVFLYFIQSIFVPAITTLVSYLFSSIYFFIFLDKKWYDKRYFLLLLRLMIISLGMYIITENISIMLGNYSILSMLIIKVVLSITIYIVFLLTFKIYSIEQILSIRNFKKKELS